MSIAKESIQNEIGEKKYNQIEDLTQLLLLPQIGTKSIFAKIDGKDFAIKI